MNLPMYVRPVPDAERAQLAAGLRSSDAFVHRRSQSQLARARGEQAPQIARHLAGDAQSVRNAIAAFNWRGLAALHNGSSRPHRFHVTGDLAPGEPLRALLYQVRLIACACNDARPTARRQRCRAMHKRPRGLGITPEPPYLGETDQSVDEVAAAVSFEHGLTTERVSGETMRATLQRLAIRGKRAKRWITSPDPE